MLNLIDFTDRGMFFIVRREKPIFNSYTKNLSLTKFISKDNESIDFSNDSKFEESIEKICNDKIVVILPIDNINSNYIPNTPIFCLEKDKLPYFSVSRNKIPNYGYIVLTETQLKNEEKFNSILKKHKNKITFKTLNELIKEMKKNIEEINEFNHDRIYGIIGYDYNGKEICNIDSFLKNQIFDNYNKTEIKRLFVKVFNKEFQPGNIRQTYPILITSTKELEKNIKNNSLIDIIPKFCKYEDFGEFIEIDFDGNKEVYSKSNLLEELMDDYNKTYAKNNIKKIMLEWSNQLLEMSLK